MTSDFSMSCKILIKIFNCVIRHSDNYNPSQNMWHKLKKYSKIGQDFKNVISHFACFLTAIINV